jgi:FlaA1/EpsC-like NDP-sugar epimerase
VGSVERLPLGQDAPGRADAGLIRLSTALDHLPAGVFSRTNQLVIDGLLSILSLWIAYLLRFDGVIRPEFRATLWAWIAILPILRPALMYATGGYDRIWRYFSMRDAFMLAATALPATLVMAIVRVGFAPRYWFAAVPLGVIAIEYMMFLACATLVRAVRRVTFEAARTSGERLRSLVVGTPDTLAEALRRVSAYTDLKIVGLLAPEGKVQGLRIGGFPVMDEPAALARLLSSHAIDVVLIADAGLSSLGEMVSTATEFGVDVRLLPTAASVLRGEVRTSVTQTPESAFVHHAAATVAPAHPEVVAAFRDRVVLVTGAGGSIGSELARQVAHLPVRHLVLLDQDENSIFEIHRELAAENGCPLAPVVADIRDRNRIERLFAQYRPHVVLHAAAYKHVPVMEHNCCEAVLNNVFGTRILAELAQRHGAERFLMISTDKAVHPSSVMGATKRVAELLVQSAAAQPNRQTRMACVRFGNVVGSRGSVVPIFLKQIAEGQPVTITDENMTRYFMTIPEAVQLVLQAVTLGSGGDVYMLDMGDPMRIMALARKLIEMSGLRPDIDIPIRVVGTRPGEKLHETLWPADAAVAQTSFPRVMAVKASAPPATFADALAQLEAAAREGNDDQVRALLGQLPIGYRQGQQADGAAAN